MLKTICYLSTSEVYITDKDIDEIFDVSTKYNSENSITGLLIYNQRNFFQVLEGREQLVDELFSKIQKDNRHKHIIVIEDAIIQQRFFGHYENGFVTMKHVRSSENLKKYLDKMSISDAPSYKKIFNVINNFLKVY